MTKNDILKAHCSKCNKDVGCSCGLKNGLCSTCAAEATKK